jgi:hypothetical protein
VPRALGAVGHAALSATALRSSADLEVVDLPPVRMNVVRFSWIERVSRDAKCSGALG